MYQDQPQISWQSDKYSEARSNFLSACKNSGADVKSHINPLKGPDGEVLATDVALFGAAHAEKLLVMVSGVHGVEGFSGSATQVGWIKEKRYQQLPDDTAVLMVHLINPWGAAYLRRYTEENIDLCRNFLNFDDSLPSNDAYKTVHDILTFGEGLGYQAEKTGPYLGGLVKKHGLEYVVDLFMAGQHDYPDGFGYGGQQPAWANNTLREILSAYNQHVKNVCIIEFHTGLGPWAYGELVTMHAGDELDRVRDWFGPWTFNPTCDKSPGEDGYREVNGHTIAAYKESFRSAEVTAVTLEFGSYPPDQSLALMLREHIYVKQASDNDDELKNIRDIMLEYHHPKDWEWRCSFWARSVQIIRQAMIGLAKD